MQIIEPMHLKIMIHHPLALRPIHTQRAHLMREDPDTQQRGSGRGREVREIGLQIERRVADLSAQLLQLELEALVDVGILALDTDDGVWGGQIQNLILVVELGVEFKEDGHGVEVCFFALDEAFTLGDGETFATVLVPVLSDREARAAAKEEVRVVGYAHEAAAVGDVDHALEENGFSGLGAGVFGTLLGDAHGPGFVVD